MRIFLGVVALVVLVAALLIEWPGVSHGGTLLEESFLGPITQRTVSYNIYLPDGYENGNEHYPVVYHLHGLGGDQGGGQNTAVPQSFEAARQAGVIGPVIIVFPNGYVDSFWADSWDGAKPAETNVALELVPHVDSHYRTIAHRGGRVIEGFSMGAFGAAKFAAKFSASVPGVRALRRSVSHLVEPGAVPSVDCAGDLPRRRELFRRVFPMAANGGARGGSARGSRRPASGGIAPRREPRLPEPPREPGHPARLRRDRLRARARVSLRRAGDAIRRLHRRRAGRLGGGGRRRSGGGTGVGSGIAAARLSLAAAPNPVRDRARVRFDLPSAGRSSLAVFDVLGRERLRILDATALAAGRHDLELDLRGWAAGSYFCRLESRAEVRTIKLVVSRSASLHSAK